MDEVIELLSNICVKLDEISSKLDKIQGRGAYNSLSDICKKLDEIDSDIDQTKLNRADYYADCYAEKSVNMEYRCGYSGIFLYKQNHAFDAWFRQGYAVEQKNSFCYTLNAVCQLHLR